MHERAEERLTVVQLALRVVGIAFASVVIVLLLAVLNGGARTAEAASQPTGLGDLLDPGSAVGSLLAPVTGPVDDVLAPVLDPVTEPVAPVVAPVTGTVVPLVDPVVDTVVAPVVDTVIQPVVDTVVAPIVDDVVVPVVAPVVDTVVVPVVDTVHPVTDTVVPIVDIVAPVPPADSSVATPPTPPLQTVPLETVPLETGATATPVEIVAIDTTAASTARGTDVTGAGIVADLAPSRSTRGITASPGARSVSVSSLNPLNPLSSFAGFPGPAVGPEALASVVSGLLTGASSAAPSSGAPSPLLAVLTATVAAMFMLSRRVTAEVSWRSALVFSSVERPG